MRKWCGVVLLGLGAFLLVVGVLTTTWAPGAVERTPLDLNRVTHLVGTVKKLDADTGRLVENPVKVESSTSVDSDASDDDTVVWVQVTCVVIDVDDPPSCVRRDDPRLVSVDTDVFASDRVSGEAVADYPGLPADAVPHDGLVNKWPFNAQKKEYAYWDGTLGGTAPAVYERTETLEGIECYVYSITISDAQVAIADGVEGTYDNSIEVWVEPRTGAIQQETQDQQRYLEDGTQVLDLQIGFTDQQLKDFGDSARSNLRLLDLITVWLPITGFAIGALCVVAGALLLLNPGARRRSRSLA